MIGQLGDGSLITGYKRREKETCLSFFVHCLLESRTGEQIYEYL
jgi:hypothetical protein